MSRLIITGGQKLKGELVIDGAKNAVLPILAATILNGGLNVIKNCPRLKDVEIMLEILTSIGCKVKIEDRTVIIDSSSINCTEIPDDFAVKMRSSIVIMGAMLSRFGKVTISYPGGCVILLVHFIDSIPYTVNYQNFKMNCIHL